MNDGGTPDAEAGAGLLDASEADPVETRRTYDAWVEAGDYDADVDEWGYRVPEIVAEMLAVHDVSGTVLDAGCGTGRAGAALAAAGFGDIVGGDFSESSLAVARSRGVYRRVQPLDLNEPLPFDTARFGAVVSAGVFSYVTDAAATLAEFVRIVQPGGSIIVSQRTDLWEQRSYGSVLESLAARHGCDVEVTDPLPYLPGHPEFGDEIGVRILTITT